MARVPGSSGDSQGFHRESDEDATKIKLKPGIEASAEGVSPQTLLSEARYTQRRAGHESGRETSPSSPQAPLGATADCDICRDPPGEARTTQAERTSPTNTPADSRDAAKRKKQKSARKQLKAPDSDTEDRGDQPWANEDLAQTFYKKGLFAFLLDEPVVKILSPMLIGELQRPTLEPAEAATQLLRMLKDAGIIPGAFNASELFDLEAPVIQRSTRTLYENWNRWSVTQPETVKLTSTRNPEYQTWSSQYTSATSEAESDSSVDLQRMTLGMSGAEMLREHQANTKPDQSPHEPTPIAAPAVTSRSPEQMQTFFNAAMNRYLKEKQTEGSTPTAGRHTTNNQDVEMESVESHHDSNGEATSELSTTTPRIRVSAISELKEYSGKDHDEDRARSWLDKEKSAFVRDQAPDSEKCLVLGDLLTGPARNRYRQLSRSMRSSWKRLFEAFQTQYCGQGVSVARQYYHAKKRSDKSPLEYLHRLNVTGLRAKLQVKDGPLATRHEDVEYFIETLDDRGLTDQLALLRLTDAEDLEETLRARQRANIPEQLHPLRINEARQPGLL
ncbi:LOW QUALITY PROTEIN: hypothetical protein PHMEG_00033366 [Phytophthora megakarya]|uniref:Retrotransposon gag domain-containing protein n=1 Tax=Phytophthora megakarya TaxID=4795 RepID=A0A225UTQ0_9STRA|nr:LOW QUALITY PROTEIN: hypothetical protein PHMEG_00033366 [Phytophthora megakarya]